MIFGANCFRGAESGLLEIVVDDAQVGQRGLPSVHARLDDPPADFGRRLVAEVVRGFENGAGRIKRAAVLLRWCNVPVRRTTLPAEALGRGSAKHGYGFAKWGRLHARWSPIMMQQARPAAARPHPLPRHSCETGRIPERSATSRC